MSIELKDEPMTLPPTGSPIGIEPAPQPATTRYRTMPTVCMRGEDGTVQPCPFLMSEAELIGMLRLAESGTRFPSKTIERYRALGLKSVRVGRRVWYRLDDVIRWLDDQQGRVPGGRRGHLGR